MKNVKNYNLAKVSIGFLMLGLVQVASAVSARALDLNYPQMVEVLKLAKAINAVNPRLEDSKYIEYAVGIYRASQKYSIDPRVMIAIAQQETGFRENLPEGAAGEIGICQIRKMWLKNPKFKVEFKKQTIKDMHKPAKSFMFAAWILKNLKDSSSTSGTLPFWSFYNAVKFEPRFKYFLAVNRNIATLRRHEPTIEAEPAMALNTGKPQIEEAVDTEVEVEAPKAWKAETRDLRANNAPKAEKVKAVLNDEETKVPSRWIPEALKKLAKQQQKNEEIAQGYDAGSRKKMVSPSIMRAAAELEVSPWEQQRPIQD